MLHLRCRGHDADPPGVVQVRLGRGAADHDEGRVSRGRMSRALVVHPTDRLGGLGHPRYEWTNPSYKWTLPPLIPFITGVN